MEDQEGEDDFNPFLTGRLDVNATDEYVPQDSTHVDDGQVILFPKTDYLRSGV